ncbi:hypothetical protein SO802_011466 [Lithocarpus litseifolius]|uniref:Uncharacterized protein n=1 Tax=Lithocarpus litseifolius TaxID=425828 RepID=A0AAW2D3H1_9ROSI
MEILAIQLLGRNMRDTLLWKENKAQVFYFKSAYQVAVQLKEGPWVEHSTASMDNLHGKGSGLLISLQRIQKCSNAIRDFFALFRSMTDRLPPTDGQRWATTSWTVRNAGSKFYFDKVQVHPSVILQGALGFLDEYQKLMSAQTSP